MTSNKFSKLFFIPMSEATPNIADKVKLIPDTLFVRQLSDFKSFVLFGSNANGELIDINSSEPVDTNGLTNAISTNVSTLNLPEEKIEKLKQLLNVEELPQNIELLDILLSSSNATNSDALNAYADTLRNTFNQQITNLQNTINQQLQQYVQSGGYVGNAKQLEQHINNINAVLTSDETDLDSIQEIVSYIKQNRKNLAKLSTSNIAGLDDLLAAKIDAEHGKQLSTNDFTNDDKHKLDNINLDNYVTVSVFNSIVSTINSKLASDNNSLNTLQLIANVIQQIQTSLSEIVRTDNNFTDDYKSKLDNLQTILDSKVDVDSQKQLSTNDFTNEYKEKLDNLQSKLDTKVNTEFGKQLSTNDFTNSDKRKLDSIDMSTKVDVERGKTLSTNDFTNEYKTKVDNALQQRVTNLTVTGDANKTITLTLADSTSIVAHFYDGTYDTDVFRDVVLNTLEFNTNTGVLTGIKDNQSTITVNLDGRYVIAESDKALSTNDFTNEYKEKLDNLQTTLDSKVAVVPGKQLSTNDFTAEDKQKLDGIDMSTKVDIAPGKMLTSNDFTNDYKSKLDNLQSALDLKVDAVPGKQLSTNDFTTDFKNKLETIDLSPLSQRVTNVETSLANKVNAEIDKHLSTNDFTNDDKRKLDSIDMSTKVDVVPGKMLTSNDFTNDDKRKLDTILGRQSTVFRHIELTTNVPRDNAASLVIYDGTSSNTATFNFDAWQNAEWCIIMNDGSGTLNIANELNRKTIQVGEIAIMVKWTGGPEIVHLTTIDSKLPATTTLTTANNANKQVKTGADGLISIEVDPTQPNHPVRKQYVDDYKPAIIKTVDSAERRIKEISRTDYNALQTKDPNTYYFIFE